MMQFELSKEFLEWFRERVEIGESNEIYASLEGVKPADISALLDEFGTEDSKFVIDLLKGKSEQRLSVTWTQTIVWAF